MNESFNSSFGSYIGNNPHEVLLDIHVLYDTLYSLFLYNSLIEHSVCPTVTVEDIEHLVKTYINIDVPANVGSIERPLLTIQTEQPAQAISLSVPSNKESHISVSAADAPPPAPPAQAAQAVSQSVQSAPYAAAPYAAAAAPSVSSNQGNLSRFWPPFNSRVVTQRSKIVPSNQGNLSRIQQFSTLLFPTNISRKRDREFTPEIDNKRLQLISAKGGNKKTGRNKKTKRIKQPKHTKKYTQKNRK